MAALRAWQYSTCPTVTRLFHLRLSAAGLLRMTARVFLDERGAPVNFSTEDRWCALPDGMVRARWSTPVRGYRQVNGRWLPSAGSAIWHLPGGPFRYAEFRFGPGAIRYNVAPADVGGGPEEQDAPPGAARQSGAVRPPAGTAGTRR